MDEVLGKRTKCCELYTSYCEQHFVKFDDEIRHFRRSARISVCSTAVPYVPS